MIVRFLRLLTAGALFAFAASALAQVEEQGQERGGPWYVAGGLGAGWYEDERLSGASTNKLAMDTGFTVNAAIGRYLDEIRVFRLEAEAVYARADIGNDGTGMATGGSLNNVALMFNVLYDIHTDSPWIPYLGGGIGNSWVVMDSYTSGGVPIADDTGNAFSWQFKGGVAYQFNPAMALTVQYRFIATDNVSWSSPAGSISSSGTKIQSAEVGFRFHF